MNQAKKRDARTAAALALVDIIERQSGSSDGLPRLDGHDDRDQAFARYLVFGVLRWLSALQWLAGQLLHRPLKSRDRDIEYLMLIGIFQLWKGGTAPHAAVHEAAAAAKKMGKPWAAGLINAVLRNFQRRKDSLLSELENQPDRHAHPEWLLRMLQADWPDHWQSIVMANNTQPPLWLRVNTDRCQRDHYLQLLEDSSLTGHIALEQPDALMVEPPVPVERLPGFPEGLVSVQDAAAQLAADYLDVHPGHSVLDACAAPGGKTCHLLERTPEIEMTALDRDPERITLIEDNLHRLGLKARVVTADASQPGTWWDGKHFDRILLDAPCSASGVIRRHPEIKWSRNPRQVESAARKQAALLDALWPLLKPGGMLVYATCSVLRCENSLQIVQFLERQADSVLVPITHAQKPNDETGRQILPGEQNMDGFYYARLRKSG